jgi:hypothetical protein
LLGVFDQLLARLIQVDYPFKPRPLGLGTLCWGSKGA